MKNPDILNSNDIEFLVFQFYTKAIDDDLLGPIFQNKTLFNLTSHLPIMYGFWNSIIFQTPTYSGNAMLKHIHVHQHLPLTSEHFDRWLLLWNNVINQNFEGDNANLAKNRATNIAQIIKAKLNILN